MTRVLRCFVLALALVCSPSISHAQDSSPGVTLQIDECIDTDADSVRRILVIELGTSMPPSAPGPATAVTRVELTCQGELIEIRVHDPVTGKSLIRRISPGNRKGRERLLALAAMELVVASWIELEATPEPVAPAADTVVDARARRSAKQVARQRLPSPRWQTTAALLGNASWIGDIHAGFGGRVIRDRSPRRPLEAGWAFGWAADVVAQSASSSVALGTITINSISAGGVVHLQRRLGAMRVRAGLGARVGAASITGKPNAPDDAMGNQITGFTASPILRLSAQLGAARGLSVDVVAESGAHVLALRGLVDGQRESSLGGFWLGAQLAVGWTW